MFTNNYISKKPKGIAARKFVATGLLILGASGFTYSQENTLPDSGNVGIGTTDPTARLQVGGSAKIDSSLVVNDSLHVKNSLTVGSDARMGADLKVDGNLILTNLEFPAAYNDQLNFLLAGADGIVKKGGPDGVTTILKSLMYGLPPELSHCVAAYTAAPTWQNGSYKIFEPCPDVKVGIGTDSPAYNLHVTGNAKVQNHTWFGTTASVGADNNSFATLFVNNSNAGAALQVGYTGTADYTKLVYGTFTKSTTELLKFNNTALSFTPFLLTGTGAMTIANNHGVTFKLEESGKLTLYSDGQQTFRVETNGTIRARHAKVDTDTWADYVFEASYRLRPLTEVESFVNAEKHLPGVPSEEELKETGIDVAEMNRLLMEKVEELTLYLIEQNKKDAHQQAEIDALKAEVVKLQQTK